MPGAWQEYYRKWWMLTCRHMPAEMADLVQPLARLVPPARTFDKRTYFPWIEGGISVWRSTTWRWRAKALTVERRDDHVAGPHWWLAQSTAVFAVTRSLPRAVAYLTNCLGGSPEFGA
jgi:hypothetical protein